MTVATRYPVVERIAQLLYARLELLLYGSFNTRASAIVRAAEHFRATKPGELTGAFRLQDRLVLLSHSDADVGNAEAASLGMLENMQRFEAACFVMPSGNDKTPTDTIVNVFAADVKKAITAAESSSYDWAQMNGLAMNSRLQPVVKFDSADWWGCIVPLVVEYRTDETNPYQVR